MDNGDVVIVAAADTGQNPARQAAPDGGLPRPTRAMTISKLCGNGLKSVHLDHQGARLGDAIAGGQQSMSVAAHVLPSSRNGKIMGNWEMQGTMLHDGSTWAFSNYHMGNTARNPGGLRPVFKKDGTVAAGNASEISDDAAAAIVMSARKAEECGLKPMARIVVFSSIGVDPAIIGTGPIPATRQCPERSG